MTLNDYIRILTLIQDYASACVNTYCITNVKTIEDQQNKYKEILRELSAFVE